MALVEHARHELALLTTAEPDEMQEAMNEHLIKMVELFADEGHSGFSAGYAIGALERLLQFQPLTPLTGEADEWVFHGQGMGYQNKRCGRVFKDTEDGPAYDIEAVIFREPSGSCFTSKDSRRAVTFPYTPSTEYLDVPEQQD